MLMWISHQRKNDDAIIFYSLVIDISFETNRIISHLSTLIDFFRSITSTYINECSEHFASAEIYYK